MGPSQFTNNVDTHVNSITPADELSYGSFIDYDSYNVVAQGVTGSMRPYQYKSYLTRKNKKDDRGYRIKSYPQGLNKTPSFRFVGDFSNRYEHDVALDKFSTSDDALLTFAFDGNSVTG